jgi:hypothetical protein
MPKPRVKEFSWGVTIHNRTNETTEERRNFEAGYDRINWNDGSRKTETRDGQDERAKKSCD